MTIADAVEAATVTSIEASMATYGTLHNKKKGLSYVFEVVKTAVAKAESGSINPSLFDNAIISAKDALANSHIPVNYDRMRWAVRSLPDRIIWMAARQAAYDLFFRVYDKTKSDDKILDKARVAAVKAAEARLERPLVHSCMSISYSFEAAEAAEARLEREENVPIFQAAEKEAWNIAEKAALQAADVIDMGASAHAATAAVFGVAMRNVSSRDLADTIDEVCEDLPKMARRHDMIVVGLVAALSMMIHDDSIYRRKYQTAIRGAEKLAREECMTQIKSMIDDGASDAAYMTLVASAYANSDGAAFESGYEDALAAAYEVEPRKSRQVGTGEMPENIIIDAPEGMFDNIPKELVQELYQKLSGRMEQLMYSEESEEKWKKFTNTLEVDYKAAASRDWMSNIISLYEMAYRAGYKGAGAVLPAVPKS